MLASLKCAKFIILKKKKIKTVYNWPEQINYDSEMIMKPIFMEIIQNNKNNGMPLTIWGFLEIIKNLFITFLVNAIHFQAALMY